MLRHVIWLLLMCLVPSPLQGQEHKTVDIAVLTEFPPEYLRTKEGEAVGFSIDILREVLPRAGLKPNFVFYKRWNELLSDAKEGKFDLIPSLGITEERQEYLYFSNTVSTHSLAAFVRASDLSVSDIHKIDARHIGVVSGNVAIEYAKEHFNIDEIVIYATVGDALYHLLAADVDVIIYPRSVFEKVAHAAGLAGRIRVGQSKLQEVKRAIGVTQRARDLLPSINLELEKFKSSPKYGEIYNRWFGRAPDFWSVRSIVITFMLVLLLLITAFLVWRFNVTRVRRRLSNALSLEEAARKNREADLLESERARQQLQQQVQQAQKLEALGTLAGGIAHDFNNILQGIYVSLAMVERKASRFADEVTSDLSEPIRTAKSFAEQGSELVKQILSFSRQNDIGYSRVNFSKVLEKSCQLLKVTLPVNIELHIKRIEPSVFVFANESQMNQIISNLITNAIHAMHKRGGVLTVSLEQHELVESGSMQITPGHFAKLTVADTGCGIPEEVVPRIFDPFFTTKPTGEGVGMGLPVVHGIVKNMEGEIVVTSAEGQGTTFQVFLPILVGDKAETKKPDESVAATDEASGRILVVDDNKELLDSLKELLVSEGYQVEAVPSPLDALALFEMNSGYFDLVMSDQTMPNMTGLELAARILAIKPSVKFLLFTGFKEEFDETIKHMDLSACLTKPVEPAQLIETVAKLLSENDLPNHN